MSKWLCENIRNDLNEVIGLTPKCKTTSSSLPVGGDFSFCHDSGNVKVPMVEADGKGGFIIVENDNLVQLHVAYKLMDDGVTKKGAEIIGTNSKESMFAFIDSYQTRILAPEKYTTFGLKSELTIGEFVKGDALNTEAKIKDYYLEVLVMLDKDRMEKIKTYLDKKTSLGL